MLPAPTFTYVCSSSSSLEFRSLTYSRFLVVSGLNRQSVRRSNSLWGTSSRQGDRVCDVMYVRAQCDDGAWAAVAWAWAAGADREGMEGMVGFASRRRS
mmetsp:Transcript_34887/g.104020  ORF Transcript_34887/g.104020 Transcript_34887/m.104020 type:complete len:99 (+) Transcript_34887:45-341(+)